MGLADIFKRKPKRLTREQYLAKITARGFDKDGNFIPDPTPMAPPVGYKKQPSMVDIVRDMVRSEKLAQEAREAGHETFEESEDFDVGDEPDLRRSGYENDLDTPLPELLQAGKAAQRARDAKKPPAPSDDPPPPKKPAPVPPTDGPGASNEAE